MEDSWVRLLDLDLSPEQLAKELSAKFLDYVRDEADIIVTERRAKVLLSLLYLSDDKLNELNDSVLALCEACETDAEEWVRVVSGIVIRWLRKVPKDREDSFVQSTREVANLIASLSTPTATSDKFSIPMDAVPTHWPFLAYDSLPANFDLAGCERNPHFVVRPKVKRVRATLKPASSSTESSPIPSASVTPVPGGASAVASKVPQKVQQLMENAPLLTKENRELVLKFFASPSTCGLTAPVEIPIFDERTPAEDRPGHIKISTTCIKLDPLQNPPKWNLMKKTRFVLSRTN